VFAEKPVAIIDIGSNSVRLVVYSGATRIPSIIFNEKVLAGLGKGVGETGAIAPEAEARALAALERFAVLVRQMNVVRTRTVATAAVREASNGAAFLAKVRRLGLDPRILSGEEEGKRAGQGVLSAIPEADGIVGDLGGGSLELVEVAGGRVLRSASLPLGVLRLDALAEKGNFAKRVAKAVAAAGFEGACSGRPFYMVGGSWRALARLDMALIDHPLPITHQYEMPTDRPGQLREVLAGGKAAIPDPGSVSISRFPTLPNANLLLDALVGMLDPGRLIVSSFGIREGLLYDELKHEERRRDPLIEAAGEAGAGLGRFAQHGDLLDRWIAPAFDDDPRCARLRLAACLLADIAWAAHPDFRAERGIDMALHGNWVAIDAPGRVMLAQALFCNFGGGRDLPYPDIAALATPDELKRATAWGYAMRLGQRLSGGVAAGLRHSRLIRDGDTLRLDVNRAAANLVGEIVERRLKSLATALGLRPQKE
jgi:exopolyphosphatase / guanosine-5'-triphosphate,3'-diphosphate pyrophosphatase